MQLFGIELTAAVRPARAAAGQDGERIADRQRVLDVVRDEDDPEPLVPRGDRMTEDDRRLLDAERRRRLVEDQDLGPEVLGPCDRQGLPFATRERADELLRVANVDPDVVHLLLGDPGGLVRIEPLEGPEPGRRLVAEEEVPADAHQRHDREVLVDGRDAGVQSVPGRPEGHRLAVDGERALVRRVDAREGLDQGRLAGPVVAEEAVDLAGPDLERDAFEGDDGAEVLRDVAGLEEGRSGRWHGHGVRPPLSQAGEASPDPVVEDDRRQEQDADRDLVPVGIDRRIDDPDIGHPEGQRTKRRPSDGAVPTRQETATDDGHRDRGQFVARATLDVRRRELHALAGRQDRRGEGGRREQRDLHARDRDAEVTGGIR